MPLYEYRCSKCGNVFEVIQKFSDAPLKKHQGCGGKVERLISTSAFNFKGSGWYVNDYAKANAGAKSDGNTESKADAKTESKTESKPETKSETKSDAKSDAKSETKSETKKESKPIPAAKSD